MKYWQKILVPVLTLVLVGVGMIGLNDAGDSSGNYNQVTGLKYHSNVIKAKIDRKQAKLDGTFETPKNPLGLAEFRRTMRSHPEGTNVTQLLLDAKEKTKSMRSIELEKDAGLWDWGWLGPGNVGGRIRAILLHPDNEDIMWLGSASGGIWRTVNGGGYWHPMTDFLPSLSVTALEMDPGNPDIIYAATGEGLARMPPGAGIFKSYDGGENWTQLPNSVDLVNYKWINDLIIHPVDGEILLAATRTDNFDGQIIRSDDGGDTWNPVLFANNPFTDLAMDPDDPTVVLASTYESVFRSDATGAGNSWIQLSTGLPDALPNITGRTTFAFGVGNDMVYASLDVPVDPGPNQGEIWRSSDNGLTWEYRSTPYHLGKQGGYNNVIWLEAGSTERIIFGGINLFKSLNGGLWNTVISRWQNYHEGGGSAHADQHVIIPHINYGNGTTTVFVGNDGGIQKHPYPLLWDYTSGWVNLANHLGITQFYHADANLDGSIILGGTQDNSDLRFLRSEGPQDWYQATTGDGTYNAINPENDDIMYTAYVRLKMARSNNGGIWYADIIDGLWDAENPERALFVAPFALDKIVTSYLVAGGRSIWRSSNHGGYWHEVLEPLSGNPLCSAVEISPWVGAVVTWVGYDDGSIRKTENYTDWTVVSGLSPGSDDFITDIEISPHDPETVIVVFGGYADNRVWITRNNGQSWNPLPGQGDGILPSIHTNCVTFHPNNPNWIYVGTDIGIFASEDMGQNWSVTQRYDLSEGPAYVEVSDLFWHSGGTLVAATYGRGIYECRPLEFVYVDIANNGGEDGSYSDPYNTFDEGYNASGNGSNLIMTGGDYDQGNRVLIKRIEVSGQGGTVIIR